ncbi:MAG: chorismate mutase [Curvibacter sp.]|nr:MAG: chorismate mutase [Curvibacter sp.]
MITSHKAKHCETMAEVRSHIDALDERITALLVERTGYMTQAARIKQDASKVHDQERIEFIAARVRRMAAEQGGQPRVVEAAYRALMDASIAFEHREFARLREGETV